MPIVCSVHIFGIWSNLVVTIITLIGKSSIKTVCAHGFFILHNKLLACDTDIALIASKVSQMPAFVHCNRVLTSENKLVASKTPLP